jgi:hypothetical protein
MNVSRATQVFQAHYSPHTQLKSGVIAIALAALAIFSLLHPGFYNNSKLVRWGMDETVAAAIFAAFLLLGSFYLAKKWWEIKSQVGPVVQIDSNGLFWTRWSQKTIGWDNVARISLGLETETAFLKLYLRNPNEDIPDNKYMAEKARAGRSALREDLYLSFYGLTCDNERLRAAVDWYLRGQNTAGGMT